MKKVLGLILELNPPHKGHKYFIEEAKRLLQPDLTIAVVSSSFTMRGDIQVIDKFTRTKIMQELGIDIILELPIISVLNSSDLFAINALSILNEFNITHLAFGTENDNLSFLNEIKALYQSSDYQIILKKYLDLGNNYSTSSLKAIYEMTNKIDLAQNSALPNNTLAIQYLTAISKINSTIIPIPIKRIGDNYFEDKPSSNIASASGIRNELRNGHCVSQYLPSFKTLYEFIDLNTSYQNLFMLLKYKFIEHPLSSIQKNYLVNEGIENRIYASLQKADNYYDLVELIKTKRYNTNKVKRTLISILLDIPKKFENQSTYYLRILGVNPKGLKYISKLDKKLKSKIITSFKNQTNEFIQIELKATMLYDLITNQKTVKNEYLVPFKEEEK